MLDVTTGQMILRPAVVIQYSVIKTGALGDLVGVMGDPAQTMSLLESPVFVMKNGDVVKTPET